MDQEPVRASSWTGSESQSREQGTCLPPTNDPVVVPLYRIRPGTKCQIRNVAADEWRDHTTTEELGYESLYQWEDGFLHFRDKGLVIRVSYRYVSKRK